MATLLKIYETNPQERHIQQVITCLKDDGLVIIPTDTVYAIACDIYNARAFDRLCSLTNKKKEKSNFSFLCYDLSNLSVIYSNISSSCDFKDADIIGFPN